MAVVWRITHLTVFADTYNYEYHRHQSLQWSRLANHLSRLHDMYVDMIVRVERFRSHGAISADMDISGGGDDVQKMPPRFDLAEMRREANNIATEMNDLNDAVARLVEQHVRNEFLTTHRDSFSLSSTTLSLSVIKTLAPLALHCFYRLYQHHVRINSHPDMMRVTGSTKSANANANANANTTTSQPIQTTTSILQYFTTLMTPPVEDNLALKLKTKSPLGEPCYHYGNGVARWIYHTRDGILSVSRIVDYRLPTPHNVRYGCDLPSRSARHMSWDGFVQRLTRWGCLVLNETPHL